MEVGSAGGYSQMTESHITAGKRIRHAGFPCGMDVRYLGVSGGTRRK